MNISIVNIYEYVLRAIIWLESPFLYLYFFLSLCKRVNASMRVWSPKMCPDKIVALNHVSFHRQKVNTMEIPTPFLFAKCRAAHFSLDCLHYAARYLHFLCTLCAAFHIPLYSIHITWWTSFLLYFFLFFCFRYATILQMAYAPFSLYMVK